MPLVALAKRIGLSRSAAQERLKRLERDGVIEKNTLRLAAPTESGVQAWFAVRLAQGFSCNDVIAALAALPEVRLCHSIAGEIDLLILVELPARCTTSGTARMRPDVERRRCRHHDDGIEHAS